MHPRFLPFFAAAMLAHGELLTPVRGGMQPADRTALAREEGQRWRGQITWQDGSLDFVVRLVTTETGVSGTMDIPAQGLTGGQLEDLEIASGTMKFTLKPPGAPEAAWARFLVTIAPDGKSASGDLAQNGMSMPVSMTLLEDGEEAEIGPPRPQTPEPPFPYPTREVTYTNGEVTLAGTLTLPEGPGPHPAAVLITGSGLQDRDETLYGHKPFLVIADHLARAGIATLRADDRGVGGSSGPVESATTDDFASDAMAGVEYLRTLPEIDASRIGLIGHSEGGLIAPMAAAESEKVAFIVMLAGPGLPGREILVLQTALIMRDSGADEATIALQLDKSKQVFDLLLAGAGDDEVAALVRRFVNEQIAEAEAAGGAGAQQAAAMRSQIDAVVAEQSRQVCSPWFRRFVAYDPRPVLARVRAPVLAVIGEFDRQVPPGENLPQIERALAENKDATVTMLPGVNHLFQTCDASTAMAYDRIEETIAPSVLETITSWIRSRTGLE